MLYLPGTPLRLTEVRRFACSCLQPPHSQTLFTDHTLIPPHPQMRRSMPMASVLGRAALRLAAATGTARWDGHGRLLVATSSSLADFGA